MFKKISSSVLLILFIALLAIYLLVRYWDKSDRSFKSTILTVDPTVVTGITIQDAGKKEVDLKLNGKTWQVVEDGNSYTADSNVVKNILAQLSDLKTKQYAGKGKEVWSKYEVTDSAATKVRLDAGNKQIAELLIGKFSYVPQEQPQGQPRMQQQQGRGDMTTFVRVNGEKEVYAVDGFLKMNFNRDPNSYRDKSLINLSPKEMTRLVYTYPDKKINLENTNGKWTLNGQEVDSTKAVKYFNSIAHLNNTNFTGDIVQGLEPDHVLTIEGNNFKPLTIKAYPVADTNINYVITSTLNPGSFFNGKKNSMFDKLFMKDEELIPAK